MDLIIGDLYVLDGIPFGNKDKSFAMKMYSQDKPSYKKLKVQDWLLFLGTDHDRHLFLTKYGVVQELSCFAKNILSHNEFGFMMKIS